MWSDFFREKLFFPSPRKDTGRRRLFPVFLPFSGCVQRCLFCAQELQTGRAAASVHRHLEAAAALLSARRERGLPALELAFFGGTFTALPPEDMSACLAFAAHWRKKGAALAFRCSTRPDCLDPALLAVLKDSGCETVELGVQSFCDAALAASRRGYTGEQAEKACRMVRESGLRLGVQLMPGMPGLDEAAAWRDVELTLALTPDCVRLYPCLVLAGSALADLWRVGDYQPWELPATVEFLAKSRLRFDLAGIPVIRTGLAEEPGFAEHILAGPHHPALGDMVSGRALYLYLSEKMREVSATLGERSEKIRECSAGSLGVPFRLFVPRRFQGTFWGHGATLAADYAALGLSRDRVAWWDEDRFALSAE